MQLFWNLCQFQWEEYAAVVVAAENLVAHTHAITIFTVSTANDLIFLSCASPSSESWNTQRSLLPLKPNERNQNQKKIHENLPKIVLIYVECVLECSFFCLCLSCLSIWHSEQHFVWFNVHHIIWELRRRRCLSIQTIVSFSCSFNFPFGHLKIENVFWPSRTTTMEMQWTFPACSCEPQSWTERPSEGAGEGEREREFIYSLQSFCALSIIHVMMTCNGDGHRIE